MILLFFQVHHEAEKYYTLILFQIGIRCKKSQTFHQLSTGKSHDFYRNTEIKPQFGRSVQCKHPADYNCHMHVLHTHNIYRHLVALPTKILVIRRIKGLHTKKACVTLQPMVPHMDALDTITDVGKKLRRFWPQIVRVFITVPGH